MLGEVKLSSVMKAANWRKLHWIIVGGESGPGARPMHPSWARTIRDDCARHGTAFFFKQVGSNRWVNDRQAKEFLSVTGRVSSRRTSAGDQGIVRGSKKSGGRLLDKKLHDQMPVTRAGKTPRAAKGNRR
jgi:protein gp37